MTTPATLDVVVIGAGPTGLACAIELSRAGYEYVVLEKGALVNSLLHFPTNMVYFTTPELLEIGGMPLVTPHEKPTRVEALKYYRKVAEACALRVQTYERVLSVKRDTCMHSPSGSVVQGSGTGASAFTVETEVERTGERRTYRSRAVIAAIGYYDNPQFMGIPGEDLPKVSHYYTEAHPFVGREVMVIGAANSAAEAALDLFRGGARVTLLHRRAEPSKHLKYWVAPDLANRIKAGEIRAFFETEAVEIRRDSVLTRHIPTGETRTLPNDFVFALTGYRPDAAFLRSMGIALDPRSERPALNADTLESNVPGLYVAGVASAGLEYHNIFIENGRFHGHQIVRALRAALPPSGRPVLAPATES